VIGAVATVVGGATIAAVSGALAFDVVHTEPYYRFAIDQTADVVEMAGDLTPARTEHPALADRDPRRPTTS